MTFITIKNQSHPIDDLVHVKECSSFWEKFKGLMFSPQVPLNGGILLVENKDTLAGTAIHMFFMRFDIAVVWIDSKFEVVDCKIAKKWEAAIFPKKAAQYVLETHKDNFDKFHTGDLVVFDHD